MALNKEVVVLAGLSVSVNSATNSRKSGPNLSSYKLGGRRPKTSYSLKRTKAALAFKCVPYC